MIHNWDFWLLSTLVRWPFLINLSAEGFKYCYVKVSEYYIKFITCETTCIDWIILFLIEQYKADKPMVSFTTIFLTVNLLTLEYNRWLWASVKNWGKVRGSWWATLCNARGKMVWIPLSCLAVCIRICNTWGFSKLNILHSGLNK